MRFLTFLVVAVTAFSVNASIAQKQRDLSSGFEVCSQNIKEVTREIVLIEKRVDEKHVSSLVSGPDYSKQYNSLEIPTSFDLNFEGTVGFCCDSFGINMNDEDARAILAYLSTMVDECNKLILNLANEKQVNHRNENSISEAKSFIDRVNRNTNSLLNCLPFKSLPNLESAKNVLVDKTNKAYSNAKVTLDLIK